MYKNKYIVLILLFATAVVFAQVVWFDFLTFDDNVFITDNPVIANPELGLTDCLKYQYKQPNYFPLTNVVFRAERILFGFNPYVFHGLNLMLHILNVVLVYFLSLKVFSRTPLKEPKMQLAAFFVALFFAIHPMHVESVAWIIDLKDLLFTFFYLLGLLFYWKWIENGKIANVLLTTLFATLSIFSKSSAVTFIAVLFLIDWLNGVKINKKSVLVKVPVLIVTLIGLHFFGVLSNISNTMNGFSGTAAQMYNVYFPPSIEHMPSFVQRICIVSFRILFWVSQSVVPQYQSVMYNREALLSQFSPILLIMPFIVLVFVVWIFLKRKTLRIVFFGLFFFLITILPSLAQSDIGISIFAPDRYLYLPILGLLMVITGLVLTQVKWVSRIVLIILILFWGYRTISYLPAWKTSEALYDHVLERDPKCVVALSNRTMIYLQRGDVDKAFVELNKLAALNDRSVSTYLNRGKIFMDRKNYSEAMADFNKALQLDSLSFDGHLNRGALHLKRKELDKAYNDFTIAYDIDSTDFLLNKNIASLYNNAANFEIALMFCAKCSEVKPFDLDIERIKANAYFNLKQFENSEKSLSFILNEDSTNYDLFLLRSVSRFKSGDVMGAYDDYLLALQNKVKIDNQFEHELLEAYNFKIND